MDKMNKKDYYSQLYKYIVGDISRGLEPSVDSIVRLLRSSELPNDKLREVWRLASLKSSLPMIEKGYLMFDYVQIYQNGLSIEAINTSIIDKLPLPYFKDFALPPRSSESMEDSKEVSMIKKDYDRYKEKAFQLIGSRIDPLRVQFNDFSNFLSSFDLSPKQIYLLWNSVNIKNGDIIEEKAIVLCLHLIRRFKQGIPFPCILEQDLIDFLDQTEDKQHTESSSKINESNNFHTNNFSFNFKEQQRSESKKEDFDECKKINIRELDKEYLNHNLDYDKIEASSEKESLRDRSVSIKSKNDQIKDIESPLQPKDTSNEPSLMEEEDLESESEPNEEPNSTPSPKNIIEALKKDIFDIKETSREVFKDSQSLDKQLNDIKKALKKDKILSFQKENLKFDQNTSELRDLMVNFRDIVHIITSTGDSVSESHTYIEIINKEIAETEEQGHDSDPFMLDNAINHNTNEKEMENHFGDFGSGFEQFSNKSFDMPIAEDDFDF